MKRMKAKQIKRKRNANFTSDERKTIIANYYIGKKRIKNLEEEYSIPSTTLYNWSSVFKDHFAEVLLSPEETKKYLQQIEAYNRTLKNRQKVSELKKEKEKKIVSPTKELVEKTEKNKSAKEIKPVKEVEQVALEYKALKELFEENKKISSKLIQEKEAQLLLANQKIHQLESKIATLKGVLLSVLE